MATSDGQQGGRGPEDPDSQNNLTDDETPLGDTAEGHEEIAPHDLPPDHPGRHRAEELAEEGGENDAAVRTPRN